MKTLSVPHLTVENVGTETLSQGYRGPRSSLPTVGVRSADEILQDFWAQWSPSVPSRMSLDLIQRIATEHPELPAEQDPSTYEFASTDD